MHGTFGTGEGSSGLEISGTTGLNGAALRRLLDAFLSRGERKLIALRREMHCDPELGNEEYRTTARIRAQLEAAGLQPRTLRSGTGLICDIGPKTKAPVIALRADIDGLPVQEANDVAYRSRTDGVAHACGHDVHTAIVLGTGLFLAQLAESGLLPGRVRLLFEPAEELGSSGALEVIANGGIDGVDRIYGLHCWPHLPVGQFGTHVGAVTAAADLIRITVTGPGGHTSRPHMTVDVVGTLASIAIELPAALTRLVDPRYGLSLVLGHIESGDAPNRIPSEGVLEGTVRCLDNRAWGEAPALVERLVAAVAGKYNAHVELEYKRCMPASVNDAVSVRMFQQATTFLLGEGAIVPNVSSLGGDSFGNYQREVPGAYVWLGTRTPGSPQEMDLHRPDYNPDERCIGGGIKALAGTVLAAQGMVLA